VESKAKVVVRWWISRTRWAATWRLPQLRKDEAAQSLQTDPALADTINKIIASAGESKIRSDMVVAAERLDQNQAGAAVPLEEHALAGLKTLQAMLDQIKLKEEGAKHDALVDAVKQAKEKIEKLAALNQKIKDAMEQVKGQKNKDDKAMDEMEEAFVEMQKNTIEALLEVPTDLHIFTELNVAMILSKTSSPSSRKSSRPRAPRRKGPTR